jgi:hypothetical protein
VNQPEARNDEGIQQIVKNMFLGVAPERADELEKMWVENDLRFNVLPDDGRDGRFVMDAGCYREIRFNHRIMRAFWVASFAAWEGYRACAEASADLSRFKQILDCVDAILHFADPEQVPIPDGIPPPGTLEDIPVEAKAAADLAIFAVGWALLHEVRHIRHQREGTSAPEGAAPSERHAEELSCDEFATRFMLERVDKYAAEHGVAAERVMYKRQAGIHFAIFAMTLMSAGQWAASDSHPAMQDRINQAWELMQPHPLSLIASAIAAGAFYTLDEVWVDVPRVPDHLLLLRAQT